MVVCVNYDVRGDMSSVIVMCFRCSDVDQESIVSRSKWNRCLTLCSSWFKSFSTQNVEWVVAESDDDSRVRGPFFSGLTFYGAHAEVIVCVWKICSHTPDAQLNVHVFVETCGTEHMVRQLMLRVQCVCVVLHLDIMLSSFLRFCVFCFPDVPRCCHRNNTICIIDVSVFEQKKQFVLHVTNPRVCHCFHFRVCVFLGSLYQ